MDGGQVVLTEKTTLGDLLNGCLDVDVLKKHGLNANHVKNDPLFFFTLP